MPTTMATRGIRVLSIPRLKPLMIVVAGPVLVCSDSSLVHRYSYEVNHSVAVPMVWPTTNPTSTTQNRLKSRSSAATARPVPRSTRALAPKMPLLSAQSSLPMLACSPVRTRKVPRMEAKIPMPAIMNGRTTRLESKGIGLLPTSVPLSGLPFPVSRMLAPLARTTPLVTARARAAMMEPT